MDHFAVYFRYFLPLMVRNTGNRPQSARHYLERPISGISLTSGIWCINLCLYIFYSKVVKHRSSFITEYISFTLKIQIPQKDHRCLYILYNKVAKLQCLTPLQTDGPLCDLFPVFLTFHGKKYRR